jgi:hypothetical protein
MAHEIEASGAGLDLGQERGTRLLAGPGAPQPLKPRSEVTRHAQRAAHLRGGGGRCFDQSGDPVGIDAQRSVGREPRTQPFAHGANIVAGSRPGQRRMRHIPAVEEHLDARASCGSGGAECLDAAPAQGREHALDVLAGAEPVDPVIDAAAGIAESLEAADLDVVRAAGLRAGAEGSEDRMLALERFDRGDLGQSAPTAQRDLLRIGGPPPFRGGRAIEHRPGAALAADRLLELLGGRTRRHVLPDSEVSAHGLDLLIRPGGTCAAAPTHAMRCDDSCVRRAHAR